MDLSGIYPPVTTCFKANGDVDYDSFAANLDKLKTTGLAGVVVFGSNGEYVFLSEEEKLKLIETAVNVLPPTMKVIVGTGLESTRYTIDLTNKAAKLGAHAALIVTPCYYGGKMDRKALYHHFTAVADSVDIPVMVYNVPKFTNVNVNPDLVAELAAHPNIWGLKDSTGNVPQIAEVIDTTPDDFNVLVGTASALYPAVNLGADGGILALANVAPRECVEIFNLTKQGELEKAQKLYLKMLPVNKAITATYGIAGLKAAMDMLGYIGGPVRSPLLPLPESQTAQVRQILETAGLL
jgi:4-hydroxy-2-oxoglutarate aldolase